MAEKTHEELLKHFEDERARLNRHAGGKASEPQDSYCKAYKRLVRVGLRLKLKQRLTGGL